jgi:hypothetical protein
VQVDRVAAVDDRGDLAEPFLRRVERRRRAVDQLVDVADGEEPGLGVDVAPRGHRDLERVGRLAPGHPGRAALGRPHLEPRVVLPDGRRAHQNRVTTATNGIDTVEIGFVGEQQPFLLGVVQVAIDGHAAAQQCVRTLNHR